MPLLLISDSRTTDDSVRVAIDPQLDGSRGQGIADRRSATNGYLVQASRVTGISFVYVRTRSRDDSFRRLLSGSVDVVPSILDVKQPVSADEVAVSRPYYRGRSLIVSRLGQRQYAKLDDLSGKLLALRRGGEYEQWLSSNRPDIRLLPMADVPDVLGAVEAGVADAALGADAVYAPLVRHDYSASLSISGEAYELPIAVRAITRASDAELLARIGEGLDRFSTLNHLGAFSAWLDTAYRPTPTAASIFNQYRLEFLMGLVTILAMIFALIQLRSSIKVTRRTEREKARLLAVMSHEVRNSANALQAALGLLSSRDHLPEQKAFLDAAMASSTSLSLLLNNALEYSRLDSGVFVDNPSKVRLKELVSECIRAFEPQAIDKGLRLTYATDPELLPIVLVDSVLLRQVLINLLSNAIKFTDAGSVDVRLKYGEESQTLIVTVHDTGTGMSDSDADLLFDSFRQSSEGRQKGGAGIGLSICREIVERLDGTIDVTSERGRGSTFKVSIPAVSCGFGLPVADPERAAFEAAGASVQGGRILLVDDHLYSARMMSAQVEALGFAVDVADTGARAEQLFAGENSYDLVFLDYNLPDTDGYSVARRLRSMEQGRGVASSKFVAISALQGDEHTRLCLQAGIDEVLTKPVTAAQLAQVTKRSARAPSDPSAEIEHVFWEQYSNDVVSLRDSAKRGDWQRVEQLAHRIYGSAGFASQPVIGLAARALMLAASGGSESTPGAVRVERLIAELEQLLPDRGELG